MDAPLGFLPKARREGIITKEADGELLIYDLERDKAHCLNPSAAAIWKLCNGATSVEEIANSMAKQSGATVDEDVVWLALADFGRSHLLEETGGDGMRLQLPKTFLGMSRREAVKRIGIGAAIALPIVISITAPTPAQAASPCKPSCATCATGECCSGVCSSNQSLTGCSEGGLRCL